MGTKTADKIKSNVYVDNVITGVNTLKEAKEYYTEAKTVFNNGKMNMREWSSNSKELMKSIPDKDRSKPPKCKVLGLMWDTISDSLTLAKPKSATMGGPKTKRQLLSCLSSVYDPLGFFTPCTVMAKKTLQDIAKSKSGWDTDVTTEKREHWQLSCQMFAGIEKSVIPRLIPGNGTCQLIAFCDASTMAFATCIYLRTTEGDITNTNLVLSKCRLNPIKPLTIPRAGLMGLLIGTRALMFAKNHLRLDVETMHPFCDSKIALFRVKAEKPPDTFVRNRVKEIRNISRLTFHYVNTAENPADWATKGKNVSELNEFWWKGPQWLAKPNKQMTNVAIRAIQVHDA